MERSKSLDLGEVEGADWPELLVVEAEVVTVVAVMGIGLICQRRLHSLQRHQHHIATVVRPRPHLI